MGREHDLDPGKTLARRQSLERAYQVKIRTYDWLADRAREHPAHGRLVRHRAATCGKASRCPDRGDQWRLVRSQAVQRRRDRGARSHDSRALTC
jgi:hypothetical protein